MNNTNLYPTSHGCPVIFPGLSVRLSVKRVQCDKTKETGVHILTPHEKAFILVFRHEEWLVGDDLSLVLEILRQIDPEVCFKVSSCEYCQRQSWKAFTVLSTRAKIVRGGRPVLRENLPET